MTSAPGRYLVTGVLGCIGSWTARRLLLDSAEVVGFDLGSSTHRINMILTDEERARLTLVPGDIADLASLLTVIDEHGIDHVIHLAAMQVPACRADPVRGAIANVAGTVAVFEAVRQRREQIHAPVVFAGSVGMFAPDDAVDGSLAVDAVPHPTNHYGVFKLANEGSAAVYALEHGIPSVGLRPMTVYGVGRDFGLTSGPTKAMAAAILGLPYELAFSNATTYQHADDVAAYVVLASRSGLPGARVFNLPGEASDGRALVDAIVAERPEARSLISVGDEELPFPEEISSAGIDALGSHAPRSLSVGIRQTLGEFATLHARGVLSPASAGLT